jgi:putative membrane protein insertion efficiency factor
MKALLIGMVQLYKIYVSPFLPSACRFEPTCSQYAMEALEKHGSIRGTGLAIYRVLRCQPLCKGGYDPVP